MYNAAENRREAPPPIGLAPQPTADLPANDERWKVPASLDVLLQSLATLRQPSGSLYRLIRRRLRNPTTRRQVPLWSESHRNRRTPVDVGFPSISRSSRRCRRLAQKTVACYTGRQDICRALGIARREDAGRAVGYNMLEKAVVRMAAVAVIDVASGRIEALAGALTPCTRQEYDGPGRGKGCDKRLPYAPRYRPDALLNPAVFHDAMPASVIKPIMRRSS